MRPAIVRFYIDADVLGLAKVLAALRPDVTYPGDPGCVVHKRLRPPCPITTPRTNDSDWIPIVAERGWLIVTRDNNIRQHAAELAAVRDHGAKLVAISGREGTGTWAQLEVVITQWRALEALEALPGPFIYAATRTGLRKIESEPE